MSPYRLGIWNLGLYCGNGKADQDGTGGEYEGAKHVNPRSQPAPSNLVLSWPALLQKRSSSNRATGSTVIETWSADRSTDFDDLLAKDAV